MQKSGFSWQLNIIVNPSSYSAHRVHPYLLTPRNYAVLQHSDCYILISAVEQFEICK